MVGDGCGCWWWAWAWVGAWMSVGLSLRCGWKNIRLRYGWFSAHTPTRPDAHARTPTRPHAHPFARRARKHAHTPHAHTSRRTCPHTHAIQGLCESVCGPCGAVTLPSCEKGQALLGREEGAPSCGYWGCAFPPESTAASCSPSLFKEGVCVSVCLWLWWAVCGG